MIQLLVATHNQGKLSEYRALLSNTGVELVSLATLGIDSEIDETGSSFQENAYLKARGYSELSGMITLSDDSGLEVDGLNGSPGIYSARYGDGICFNDQERVELLLNNLTEIPWHKRTARFRCVIAICKKNLLIASVVGSIAGMIQYKPYGENGFGYDPVFYLPSYKKTLAQLDIEDKNLVSHRSDALHKVSHTISCL
jgi:XTP/dITP diphosphohydrolase